MMAWQWSVPQHCRNIGIDVRGSIVDLNSLAMRYICKCPSCLISAGLPYRWSYLKTKELILPHFIEINCLLTTRYFHSSILTSTQEQFLLLDSVCWAFHWFEQASALFRVLKCPCLMFLPEKARIFHALDCKMKLHGWFRVHGTKESTIA